MANWNINNAPLTIEDIKCIRDGIGEPNRSACRSSWKAIGFYITRKLPSGVKRVIRKTWRH